MYIFMDAPVQIIKEWVHKFKHCGIYMTGAVVSEAT